MARWAEVTPQHFTFDVKLHGLLSRHAAQLEALAPLAQAGKLRSLLLH